jgi:hypothetical protein
MNNKENEEFVQNKKVIAESFRYDESFYKENEEFVSKDVSVTIFNSSSTSITQKLFIVYGEAPYNDLGPKIKNNKFKTFPMDVIFEGNKETVVNLPNHLKHLWPEMIYGIAGFLGYASKNINNKFVLEGKFENYDDNIYRIMGTKSKFMIFDKNFDAGVYGKFILGYPMIKGFSIKNLEKYEKIKKILSKENK